MPEGSTEQQLTVYKHRWFVLFIVVGSNIVNGALWISFAPINGFAAVVYGVSPDTIDFLSTVFFIAFIPFTLIAMKLCESKGLRVLILIGSWTNLVGAMIRTVSVLDGVGLKWRFPLVMLGQTIAAIGQPFIVIISTRVSEIWFPENQRSISTTLGSLANGFGTAFGSIISPYFTHIKNDGILIMNGVWALVALVFSVMALIGIRSSQPPTAPSISALRTTSLSYALEFKQLLRDRYYLLLLFTTGNIMGIIFALQTMMQQFLCIRGFSDDFSGVFVGLITGVGIIGAVGAGILADKTKKFEEIAKIAIGLGSFFLAFMIMFIQMKTFSNEKYVLILLGILCGMFLIAGLPVCLELAAEGTYPVNEVLSAGLIIMLSQITGIIYVLIFGAIGKIPKHIFSLDCESDLTNAGYIASCSCIFTSVIFILFYKADFKRSRVEDLRIVNRILSNENSNSLEGSVHIYD